MIASSPLEGGLLWPHIERGHHFHLQCYPCCLSSCCIHLLDPQLICTSNVFKVHQSWCVKLNVSSPTDYVTLPSSYHAKWVLLPRMPALAVSKVTHPAPKLEILTPSAPSPFTSNWPWSPKQFTSSVCLKACSLLVHPVYLFIRD